MFELMQAIAIDAAAGCATGRAHLAADHPMLRDHFPGAPICPGSIAVELAAQVAGPLAEEMVTTAGGEARWAFLGMIRRAVFRHPILLPADLRLEARAGASSESTVAARVEIFVASVETGGASAETGATSSETGAASAQTAAASVELVMGLSDTDTRLAEARIDRDVRLARWKAAW